MSTSDQSHAGNDDTRPHQCGNCDRSFKRAEHLRRHQSVHEYGSKFVCQICDKRFARSDVLARHSASHDKAASTPARSRACLSCAQARERCSRTQPCDRCSTRGLVCSFPPSRHDTALKRSHDSAFAATSPDGNPAAATADIGSSMSMPNHNVQYTDLSPQHISSQQPAWISPQLLETGGANYDPLQDYDFPMNWLPVDLTAGYPADGLAINDDFWALNNGSLAAEVRHEAREAQGATPHSSALSQVSVPNTGTREENGIDVVTPGTRYTNSMDGARISSSRRAKLRSHLPVFPGATSITLKPEEFQVQSGQAPLHFADNSHISFEQAHGQPLSSEVLISTAVYNVLNQQFMSLCAQPALASFEPYFSSYFPAIDHISTFVKLYFQYFDPILPFLHKQDEAIQQSWILVLAMCTIGCHYSGTVELESWQRPFQEFLRRALLLELDESSSREPSMQAMQALVLSHVSMLYGSSPAVASYSQKRFGFLVELLREAKLLTEGQDGMGADASDLGTMWTHSWNMECRRRLGYAIWLLDCLSSIHFQRKPLLSITEAHIPLPDDRVWRCRGAQEWWGSDARLKPTQTLQSALETLILQKHCDAGLCDFGRLILLHAVYHKVWEVQSYIQRPLSWWIPSAEPDQNVEHPGRDDWLLGNETFSSWRNLACDCIDTLHWAANGRIAQLSGIEPPIVFHLHFSRVVLLVPYQQILTIVAYKLHQCYGREHHEQSISTHDVSAAEQDIARWVQRDEHKARLAMIHAGCLLWHARRFGAYAFYEAQSIYVAILTIWTYSSMLSEVTRMDNGDARPADRSSSQSCTANPAPNNGNLVEDIDSDDQPTFIRLDRPNDDEMVQLFVRKGRPRVMRAHITGIGEVCSPSAKTRTLREGIKILTASHASAVVWQRGHWQCARNLQLLLQALQGNG